MKKVLKSVKLTKIDPTKKYILMAAEYERYGDAEASPILMTGDEVLKKAKEWMGIYEGWLEDEEKGDTIKSFGEFLRHVVIYGLFDEDPFDVYAL